MLLGYFNTSSLLNAILLSTQFHFCSKKLPKSRLGCVLGRLGRVLGRLGALLGRLKVVLELFFLEFGRARADGGPGRHASSGNLIPLDATRS